MQAVTEADKRPEEHTREVSECTKRIAFLGTPFQGSDKAKWADFGRSFVSFFASTSSELLKGIEIKSDSLVALKDSFHLWLPSHKVDIFCFWEELAYKFNEKVKTLFPPTVMRIRA